MSLQNAAVNVDSTGITANGGTSTNLASQSDDGTSRHMTLGAGNFLTRNHCEFKIVKPKPSVGAPNGFTQARSAVSVKFPKTLANGNTTTNVVRIEISSDVETTDSDRSEMCFLAAQMLGRPEFADFWQNQQLG